MSRSAGAVVRIGGRAVGAGHPVFVIAEAGVNHDGSIDRAHALIHAAATTGADAVKFQTFATDALVSATADLATYQKEGGGGSGTQREMLRRLELPRPAWADLQRHATEAGLVFLSTPFDVGSLRLLLSLGVPAIKIGSGDLTNVSLLREAARAGRPVICSTGMGTLNEVASAVAVVRNEGGEIILLHCVSSYPAPAEQLNLRAIHTLAERFQAVAGFSDHSLGRLAASAAVAAGAAVVEKHFTLDRGLPGPDHRSSLEADEFAEMVREIRTVELMLGSPEKSPQSAETELLTLSRRSLVYARDLAAGAVLGAGDLIAKRPGGGLPPTMEPELVGRRLRQAVAADQMVAADDLTTGD